MTNKPSGEAKPEEEMTAGEWLKRELATNPMWKEAPASGECFIIVGGRPLKPKVEATARARALEILATNPHWKEVPASDEIFTVGGARPIGGK